MDSRVTAFGARSSAAFRDGLAMGSRATVVSARKSAVRPLTSAVATIIVGRSGLFKISDVKSSSRQAAVNAIARL